MKEHLSIKKLVSIYIMVTLLVGADQVTKYTVSHHLAHGRKNPVIEGFFYLTHCSNTGGAWSIFSGNAVILGIISLISALIIAGAIFYCRSTLTAFSLGAVLAGALGNMIDRFAHGYVVDFLDFIIFGYDFPVFNVADICVVCGGIGLILTVLITRSNEPLFYRPGFLRNRKEEA